MLIEINIFVGKFWEVKIKNNKLLLMQTEQNVITVMTYFQLTRNASENCYHIYEKNMNA